MVERKLATVVFVDLVGSTALIAASDPEVARRRVTQFFELVSSSIEAHGGTVESYAGDAVMAAFGIPLAHEDDAERALRAAIEIRAAVGDLRVECRIGVEAGEVLSENTDLTLATGRAVNLAARLQQSAEPNEILVGPAAHRLGAHAFELSPTGKRNLRGFSEPVPTWRLLSVAQGDGKPFGTLSAPLIGRDVELAMLRNTFERTIRDRRAHLVTIYGEPGVGKSRLARDFVAGLEDATVLVGRCLPYGEGITYWPLAEMIKAAAVIADNDPPEEAREKLRAFCGDEAVADVLALVSGVVEDVEMDRPREEIAWAAREWVQRVATGRALVLGFEDVHWSEEPLLGLIEHLARWVRDAPLLILCLARPELLEIDARWGGGRVRGATIELGALPQDEAGELVDVLLAEAALSPDMRNDVLAKTEGNPLFVEETVRMLAEGAEGRVPIPDTVQALIAARIDGLSPAAKLVLQRAAVIGRVFWRGAIAEVSNHAVDIDDVLEALLLREFIVRETHSSISGEEAFRFKHVLIREIAYAGLTKLSRAELHAAFAAWLQSRGVEELVEIRAYHLDRATSLWTELDGVAPDELTQETAAALKAAGMRALAREANRSGRTLLLRAVELAPTLERRYQAARAAWRLNDIPAVALEMERVRAEAHRAGNRHIEGRALIALGEVTAFRDSDTPGSRKLIEEGLALLEPDDLIGRFDALRQLNTLARWVGDFSGSRKYAEKALEASREAGRKDLMSWATNGLASSYLWEMDLDRAEELALEAARLAEESRGIVPRGDSLNIRADVAELRGDVDEAIELFEAAIALFAEAGAILDQGRTLNHLAELVMNQGDDDRAEGLARQAIRMLGPLGDRGYLCESQRILAEILVHRGKIEEAERYALEAIQTVGPQDVTSLATTQMALGVVRAAQGRDEEAEALLREAVNRASNRAPGWITTATVRRLTDFLRAHGRDKEAAELDGLGVRG
ncbi:MAG TPA: AAA family ATPase [Gaiellaceae bacterium]|nr:AAA family ATPase [Gaiellaceae bacterium]